MFVRSGKFLPCAVVLPLLVALSACGGGGSDAVTACVQTPDHGCIAPAEFNRLRDVAAAELLDAPALQSDGQWGLRAINTHQAHAAISVLHGAEAKPGAGVTVGVIDTGIDLDHPAFQDGAVSETLTTGTPDETGARDFSHGTAVASVIVGRPVPGASHQHTGIAPYATLRMTAIRLGSAQPDVPFDPVPVAALDDSGDAARYRDVLSQDLDVLNQSFGIEGLIENYDETALRAAYGQTIEALAQRPDGTDKTILVWSAGNSNTKLCRPGTSNCDGNDRTDYLDRPAGTLDASSPNLYAGLPARIEELRSHSIAVAAIGEDGEIADFSNRCGIAAQWCIAAPGHEVLIAYFGPDDLGRIVRGYGTGSGTSFAAPMVTGGLALMKQFFRDQMPNTDLVTRLYATADKSGIYADTAVYGQGLMDLGAAVAPVGEATVAMGSQVGDAGHRIKATQLRLGGALGDGFAHALSGREIAAFDALGAPFWYALPDLSAAGIGPSPMVRLRGLMAPGQEADGTAGATRLEFNRYGSAVTQGKWRFGIHESPVNAEASLLNLAENATTFTFQMQNGIAATAFTTTGLPGRHVPETGAVLAWRPSGEPFGLRLGWLEERKAMLGLHLGGCVRPAFGRQRHRRAGGRHRFRRLAPCRGCRDRSDRGRDRKRDRHRHVGSDHERGLAARRPAPGRRRSDHDRVVPAAARGARPGAPHLADRPHQGRKRLA